MWLDEWLTTEAVSGTLPDLVRHVSTREGIAPGFFLLQWVWRHVAGDSDIAFRALPAMFGVSTIPVAYAIAVDLQPRTRFVARVAALLVALNPMLVWYSQDARPYSIIGFFGALSFFALVRIRRCARPSDVAVWALSAACLVSLHYVTAVFVAVEALVLLARAAVRRQMLVACLAPLAVLIAQYPVAIVQNRNPGTHWAPTIPLSERLADAGQAVLVGPSLTGALWIPIGLAVAVGGFWGLKRADRHARRVISMAGGVGVAASAIPVLMGIVGIQDVFIGRYVIASFVPLTVAVALALGAAPRRVSIPALVVIMVVTSAGLIQVQRSPVEQRPEWKEVATAGGSSGLRRALVARAFMVEPLLRYVPGSEVLGSSTVEVDEIDLVYSKAVPRCDRTIGLVCSYRDWVGVPLPESIVASFRMVDRVELDNFIVERHRAVGGPVAISREVLLAQPEGHLGTVLTWPTTRQG